MNSILILLDNLIGLYQTILIIYIIATWLISFNIINTTNRLVYSIMDALYRLCEPSFRLVRRYLPNFGSLDISPVIILLLLYFIRNLLNEYWPR